MNMGAGESIPSPSSRPPDREAAHPLLEVENLTKVYGDGEVTAVDGVSFEVERGRVVGLLGPNGAGKTTTIKMISGLVTPTDGVARVAGIDLVESPREGYEFVSAMLEGARNVYWRLTVRENLRFFSRLGGRHADGDRISEVIELVGLEEKADTVVNKLSRGMKQKAAIGCALVRETPVVFLDEPTLGLDVESAVAMRERIQTLAEEQRRTILLSSHDMELVEATCDRVIIMVDGEIAADDDVDALTDVFETTTYRVTLDREPADAGRRALERRFDASNWGAAAGDYRFDVHVACGERLHEVMDVVRELDARLVSIDSAEPDLEETFLRLTDDTEIDP